MPFDYDPSLPGLLTLIEDSIVASVVRSIMRLAIAEPCYALFLWYDDSSSTDCAARLGIGTRSVVEACRKQYHQDASSQSDCIWRPQQALEEHRLIPQHEFDDELKGGFARAYELMLAANTTSLPLPDEGEILLPFRAMLWRAAKRLSACDWQSMLSVDDAFVVVALDTIGYWLQEDLRACIDESRIRLLEQRGLMAKSMRD